MHEFEPFETQKFVGRLLGRGDWGGFIDKVKDVIPEVSLLRRLGQEPEAPGCTGGGIALVIGCVCRTLPGCNQAGVGRHPAAGPALS